MFLVLSGGPRDAGLGQTARSKTTTDVSVQQPDAVKPKGTSKKGSVDASRSTTNTVATQPGSQQPNEPLTFRLSANKEKPYQGELVHFELTPSRQSKLFPFEFDFADGEKQTTVAGKLDITHRFTTPGPHSVTATAKLPGVQIANFEARVENPIDVQKLPLTVCGVSADTNLQIFAGQEISLATADLNDPLVKYRFVFDRTRACAPTRSDSGQVGTATSSFVCVRPGHYAVHAEIAASDLKEPAKSDPRILKVDNLPQSSVDLKFIPSQPTVDQEVTFTASVNSPVSNSACFNEGSLQYRFSFDDGSVRDWSPDSTAKNQYKADRTYHAQVEVRFGDGGEPTSKTVPVLVAASQIIVDHPPPPICIPCFLIGGVIVLVCGTLLTYFVYRLFKKPPSAIPPTSDPGFVPAPAPPNQPVATHVTYVFDSGERTAHDAGPQLSVNIQVRLNTQVSQSETHLTLNEGRLIKSVRRYHA